MVRARGAFGAAPVLVPVASSARLSLVEVRGAAEVEVAAGLMRRAHEESRYSGSPWNGGRFRRYHEATTLADPDRYGHVLAHLGGRAVGQLTVTASYLYWCDRRVAVVGLVYVVREHRRSLAGGRTFRRLLDFAVDWARARRIDELQVQVSAGVRLEAIDGAVRRLGFAAVGGTYVLPVGGA